jgi:hypothetical protein
MRETSEVVQIRAELDSIDQHLPPGVEPIDVGHLVEVIVNLAAPLAGRTVLAESGEPLLLLPTSVP